MLTKTLTVEVGKSSVQACVEKDFYFKPGSRLTGKVTDEHGNPVEGIRVIAALFKGPSDEKEWSWFEDYTDKFGHYEIEGLSPGTYSVGVKFDGPTKKEFPFPPTYYPGVQTSEKAQRITIDQEKSFDGFDLKLSTRLIPRVLQGVVLFPDGTPARGAMVEIKEERTSWRMDMVDVGSDGHFSLSAFEGVSYFFYVYQDFASWGMNKESQKVYIPKTGQIEPLRLTVPLPKTK